MVCARSCAWLVVWVCVLGLASRPASAQILPQEIKSAKSELSAEQRQTLAEFVDPLMEGLVTGKPKAVSEARATLLREFTTPGTTDIFKDALSRQVTSHMNEAMASEHDLVRINAMILATQLTNEEATELIDQGLADENAAVQYWGAKAYRDRVRRSLGENGESRLPAEQQRRVIERAKRMIAGDAAVPIVQSSFEILLALSIPEAQSTLLEILNERVAQHGQQPQLSYRAEQEAIAQLSNKFVRERRVNREATQALLAVSYRYFVLIGQQMQVGNVLEENQSGHKAMMDQAHQALAGISAREQDVQLPRGFNEVKDWIKFNKWDELIQIAQRWQPVLQAPPFEIEADRLTVDSKPAAKK